jgi:NhaP-type Na+/H+ or K+/H+ antiporter
MAAALSPAGEAEEEPGSRPRLQAPAPLPGSSSSLSGEGGASSGDSSMDSMLDELMALHLKDVATREAVPADVRGQSESALIWMCLAAVLIVIIVADRIPLLSELAFGAGNDNPFDHSNDMLLSRVLSEADHSSSSSSSSAEEHHTHPHVAMFFFVTTIVIGASITHAVTFHMFRGVPQTVALFIVGLCLSVLFKGFHLEDSLGNIGASYEMWLAIDPHLLLTTMLPPLLAGDAMTIDTDVASNVAKQCMFLAGPGVVINALIAALFLYAYLPHNWTFMLCLTTGSILCATDPVAVVALLKDLGASPTLTVQIQGESLLNDGTAIVLYTVAYNILAGEEYLFGDIMIFLIKTALFAFILGMAIGGFFYLWIKMANNKLDHSSSMIQVSLTLACAYSSFIIAEGIFKVSGVLSTVAASLVLAYFMWPEVVARETMHTIWHVFEYLGNTIIFLLAGSLTGSAMVNIAVFDYIHLLVIYVALLVIRFLLVMCSRPILTLLSPYKTPVTVADAMVMSWGGLRGAVGLVLAIQVSTDKANGTVNQEDADRVLFYVGGIALLTLVINATTCPALVNHLGLTKTPETKRKLMLKIQEQLAMMAVKKDMPTPVKCAINRMLHDIKHHLDMRSDHHARGAHGKTRESQGDGARKTTRKSKYSFVAASGDPKRFRQATENASLLSKYKESRGKVQHMVENGGGEFLSRIMSDIPFSEMINQLIAVLAASKTDKEMLRGINEAFLNVIKHMYWQQIEKGLVTTDTGRILLDSVTHALSKELFDLRDFETIQEHISQETEYNNGGKSAKNVRATWTRHKSIAMRQSMANHTRPSGDQSANEEGQGDHPLLKVLDSTAFNVAIMVAIIGNCVLVFAEEYKVSGDGQAWFIIEMAFNVMFTVEFVLKFWAFKLSYFFDSWNVFDFVLVVVGWLGVAMMAFTTGEANQETDLARSVKVIKILRAVRLARLVRLAQEFRERLQGRQIEPEFQEHMGKFDCVLGFISAHIGAQREIMRFFGSVDHHEITDVSPELAHCILQSQLMVFSAIHICIYQKRHLPAWMLLERDVCLKNIEIIRKLEEFMEGAMQRGLLTASEAELIIHAMHHHIEVFMKRLDDLRNGRVNKPKYVEDPGDDAPPPDPNGRDYSGYSSVGLRSYQSVQSLQQDAPDQGSGMQSSSSLAAEQATGASKAVPQAKDENADRLNLEEPHPEPLGHAIQDKTRRASASGNAHVRK